MMDLEGGPTELDQHFAYIGREISHGRKGAAKTYNRYGLAVSLAYTSAKEGRILLVQLTSTCLRGFKNLSDIFVHPQGCKFRKCLI